MHNRVEILGRLGKDPETRETPKGTPYCVGSVVSNYKVKKTGTDEATWFRISAWGPIGQILFERGKKGMRIFVTGRLRPMEYENERGFFRGYEVMVEVLRLLD